jgi:hypothetical protein
MKIIFIRYLVLIMTLYGLPIHSMYAQAPEINIKIGSVSYQSNSNLNFDNVFVSSSGTPVSIVIENYGYGILNFAGTPKVLINGPQAGAFQINESLPYALSSVGNATFTITFQPLVHGLNTASISIANNDPDENPFVINLFGIGMSPTDPVLLDVNTWLNNNSSIASKIAWQTSTHYAQPNSWDVYDNEMTPWANWNASQKADLQKAFQYAYNWYFLNYQSSDSIPTIPTNISYYDSTMNNLFPTVTISNADAWKLYVNWVAHSMFLEAYQIIPWSMASYDDESKKLLLNSSRFMLSAGQPFYLIIDNYWNTKRKNILGWTTLSSPIYTYKFLSNNNILQPGMNKRQVIEKLLQWCNRDNMSHFNGDLTYVNADANWHYIGAPPVRRMVEGTNAPLGFSHWTAGCHGTDGFLRNVLRAVNIPVELMQVCSHSVPIFRTENVFMSHGDNPYGGNFKDSGLPTSAILVPGQYFEQWFGSKIDDTLNIANLGTQPWPYQNCAFVGVQKLNLSGYVYNWNGLPADTVKLTFTNLQTVFEFPIQTVYTVLTDVSGHYSIDIEPGTYKVTTQFGTFNFVQPNLVHNFYPTLKNYTLDICTPPASLSASAIGQTTATLSWAAVPGVSSYTVNVRPQGSLTWSPVITSALSVLKNGLYSGTTYEYQVGAACPGNPMNWSAIQTFTTYCYTAGNLQATNISGTSVKLSWDGGVTHYNWDGTTVNSWVAYKKSSGGSWTTITVNGADTLWLYGLQPETSYFFEILTLCKNNVYTNYWSPAQSFTTTVKTGADFGHPILIGTLAQGANYNNIQNNDPVNSFKNDYGQASDDIFYSFTLSQASKVTIDHCSSAITDSYLYLFNSTYKKIASNDDNGPVCAGSKASLVTNLAAGTYYIVSEGYGAVYGDINTHVKVEACAAAPGSGTANPILINHVNNICFTDIKNNAACFTNIIGQTSPDIYYKFTLSSPLSVAISTCGSELTDTYLHLLNSSATQIGYNDDNGPLCTSNQASLKQSLSAGTYYIVVEGFNNYTGFITLNVWDASNASCTPVTSRMGDTKEEYETTEQNYVPTDVLLYPNPTSGNSFLAIPELNEKIVIKITDVYGKIVTTMQTSSSETEINVSELANGIYYLSFQLNGKTLNKKLEVIK